MSSLWTPDGERPVGKPTTGGPPPAPSGPSGSGPSGSTPPAGGGSPDAPDDKELAEQVEAMQRELASAPVEVVVANHCYGLFELAAVYLSQVPPLLPQSRLAIDALACLVDGLKGRLGEAEGPLKDGLSQLQLAYVQIDGAQRAGAQVATSVGVNGASDPPASGDAASETPTTGDAASSTPTTGGPAPETTSGTEAEPGE